MIKKFEGFISDRDNSFKYDKIVVSKLDTLNGLKKNRKYKLVYPQSDYAIERGQLIVHDLYNNEIFYGHKNNFISEIEYELGDDLKKYNL